MLNALSLLLISVPVLAFTWAYGGTRAATLAEVMPWASFACLIGIFLFPQRRDKEAWDSSIKRVLKGFVKDPCLWVVVVFLLYLVIPLFNVALCPTCDWQRINAGENPFPPFRFLPFCVNPKEHAGLLWWFGPLFLVALGVRHGLVKSGKRAFFEGLVWNGAALSFFGFIQLVFGAKFPYWGEVARPIHFFSVFGYPNDAGSFFAFTYVLSLGLWCQTMARVEERDLSEGVSHPYIRAHYPVLLVALNFCAVLASLCRAAMSLSVLMTFVFVVYSVMRAFSGEGWRRGLRFRHSVTACVLLFVLAGAVFVYAPPEVGREFSTVNVLSTSNRVTGKGQYHTRVATAMMRDFPFFGVGGWGYKHFCLSYMTPADKKVLQTVGGVNVHNDYLQYLAELGMVGAGLLLTCFVLLATPWMRTWRHLTQKALAMARASMGASTLTIFVVEPPVLWTFLAIAVVAIHAFGDCPLRAPAILVSLATVMPAVCGFLPHDPKKHKGGDHSAGVGTIKSGRRV
ncbi:MAG: O-antigen ligase family protein [Kiritimatiellae bacterium]|nr:O-antigen ligase family protein [Kiritimatiellia bacterium]